MLKDSEDIEDLKIQISVMKQAAIRLRNSGGEPSDNFKKLLCMKVARLKEMEGDTNAQQSNNHGQDNP